MAAAAVLIGNLLLVAAFQLLRAGAAYDSTFGLIANLAMLVPTVACFARAVVGGPRRAAACWLGFAMLSQTAGNVIYSTWTQFQADPPVPSPSDFAYLGFYVSVTAAVVCLVRRDHGAFPRALWLDGALGAAGAATALAAVMSPVLSSPQGEPRRGAGRRGLHGRGPAPGRDDLRRARGARHARRVAVAVAGRRARRLLRDRRRLRLARERRHLLRGEHADACCG